MADERKRRKELPIAVVILALSMLYILSYAPVARYYRVDPMSITVVEEFEPLPFYAPVEWLIGETPVHTPLMWWAWIVGAEPDVEYRCLVRKLQRNLGGSD